jgi:hypothetical protein
MFNILYKSNIGNISNTIKEYVQSTEFPNNTLEKKAYTSTNIFILNESNLVELKEAILKEFKIYQKTILHNDIDFEITNSWILKIEEGGYVNWHIHKDSKFTGAVHVVVEDTSGDFIIEYNDKTTQHVQPKEGALFLFPADLNHMVDKNLSKNTRYSIAFNLFPIGQDGGYFKKWN